METMLHFNMWSVLKTDIRYHKPVIGAVYGIGLIMLLCDIVFSVFDIHVIMGVTSVSFYVGMWIIGVTDDKEKRDRHQAALPIPIIRQSMVRLLFCVLFQTGITSVWLLLFLLKYTAEADPLIWDILSYNALNITVIMLFVIFADLGHLGTKAYRLIFLIGVLSIFFFLIYLSIIEVVQYPLNFGPDATKSPWEALLYTIVCAGLLYYDYTVFLKRKSYLN